MAWLLPGAGHQDFPFDLMVPAVRGFAEEVAGGVQIRP